MNGITLWMAFVDAIPVFIFLAAALILIKDFENSKGYEFIMAGTFMLFGGAILKVAWKTMYALDLCDYYTLSESFFPMQTIGFVLMSIGISYEVVKLPKVFSIMFSSFVLAAFIGLVIVFTNSAKKDFVRTGTEVLPYESHMPFLLCTFVGFMVMQVLLIRLAIKRNTKLTCIAFIISAMFMIAEAVVGSMFNGSSDMHWVAQYIHIAAEIGLFFGALFVHKAKLKMTNTE